LYREDHVSREVVALIKILDVGAFDVVERGIFGLPAVRRFGAVNKRIELTLRDTVRIVIAAGDTAA
jgi:hypothetical protein